VVVSFFGAGESITCSCLKQSHESSVPPARSVVTVLTELRHVWF
jgi:hypothetical protein